MSKQVIEGAKEYIKKAIEEYAEGTSKLSPRTIMDQIESSQNLNEHDKSELIDHLVNCIEASTTLTESGKKHALDSLINREEERE